MPKRRKLPDPVFAISEQSPGSVTFSCGVENVTEPPVGWAVTNNVYDENSALASSSISPLEGWIGDANIAGWIGYAAFDTSGFTGASCYAEVTDSTGAVVPGQVFSYIAP